MIGQEFGPYRILEKIGAGGMGEVYRARDTRLQRDVAIKVLPETFASDPERLARFEREAQVLASLNHPNIAQIHGIEERPVTSGHGVRALVMELVDGETLAERVARGAIPVDEALAIARQLATALEAAHERGIIHRDLKPANVKVTPAGIVKVLDFGLAKTSTGDGSPPDLTQSPTVTLGGTREGVLLGTAAYMSPEQARGKPVDRRTDIWAFGCVLYELLSGRSAFARETISETIAGILAREPQWQELPDGTPPAILLLLRRCLRKDPVERLRDIGDARIELREEIDAPGPGERPAPARLPRRRERIAWTLAAIGAVAAVVLGTRGWLQELRPDRATAVVRSAIVLPPAQALELQSGSLFAVSPDGTRLVYSGRQDGRVALYVRALDRFHTERLAGTEGASHPFFSPDGRWIGFFADGALRRVPIDGGVPTVIVATPVAHGASWAPDNTIVFARPGAGLMRVAAEGGTPQPVTALDTRRGETGHDWPQVLPGGERVLFTVVTGNDNGVGFAVVPLEGGDIRLVAARSELHVEAMPLLPPGDLVQGRYVSSGHLVYGQVGAIWGLPFDLGRLEARGSPIELLQDVFEGPGGGAIYFGVTEQGSLVYVPGGADRALVRTDRRGRASPISSARGPFRLLRLSDDGRRVAVCLDVRGGPTSIWAFDTQRGTTSRVTWDGHNLMPVWTPDSRQIAHVRSGRLHLQAVDDTGSGEPILSSSAATVEGEPYSWTPDGRTLLFSARGEGRQWDLWAITLSERVPTPVLATADNERLPVASPDGRWLAYISDESGRYEVYVRGLRQPGARVQVSLDGGTEPVWSRDGRELFFRRENEYYTVPVRVSGTFEAGQPQYLFSYGLPFVSSDIASYDVTPDGQHFVMIASDPDTAPTHFRLVSNWLRELGARVPAAATP